MTSSMRCPRSSRAFVSPSAHRTASTRLLLPLPFGPTIAVIPGSKITSLRAANVLNPDRVIRRSLIRAIVHVRSAARQHLGPPRSHGPKIWCSLRDRRCAPTAAGPTTATPAAPARGGCRCLGGRRSSRLAAHQGFGGVAQGGEQAPAAPRRRCLRGGDRGLGGAGWRAPPPAPGGGPPRPPPPRRLGGGRRAAGGRGSRAPATSRGWAPTIRCPLGDAAADPCGLRCHRL